MHSLNFSYMNISIDITCIQAFEILRPEHNANYMQRPFVTVGDINCPICEAKCAYYHA